MKKFFLAAVIAASMAAKVAAAAPVASDDRLYTSVHDLAREQQLAEHEADWRNGAVVYQVLVDRFAPPADLAAKKDFYAPPKKLRAWKDEPKKGTYVPSIGVWRMHKGDLPTDTLASIMKQVGWR